MAEIVIVGVSLMAGLAVYVGLVAVYDWTWRERGARIHRGET